MSDGNFHQLWDAARNNEEFDDTIECPLTSLGLLIKESDGERIRFSFGPKKSLPVSVFAYALADFWNSENNLSRTMELKEILRAEGSPGLIFKLDQDSVLSYLDETGEATSGYMAFEDTPLVRRVVRSTELPIEPVSFLEAYYGNK